MPRIDLEGIMNAEQFISDLLVIVTMIKSDDRSYEGEWHDHHTS